MSRTVNRLLVVLSLVIPHSLLLSNFIEVTLLVSMNWTGGRLRRQSHNRPDSTLKIQKQYFAKARLKQRESHNKARIASIAGPSFAFCSNDAVQSPHCSSAEDQLPAQSRQSIEYVDRTCNLFDSPNSQVRTTGLLNNHTEDSVVQ